MLEIEAPIGVIDSGVGGLSVLRCLQRALPHEKFLYVGDTARAPYGIRTKENILELAEEIINYLERKKIKELVIACNTITFVGVDAIRGVHPFHVVGMDTGAKLALEFSRKKRIGVLATNFTIGTGVHKAAIQRICPEAEVFGVPGTKLVPLIERDQFGTVELAAAVNEYADKFKANDVDVILLSCTHYPFIREILEKEMGKDVTILDPAQATAQNVKFDLERQGLLRTSGEGHLEICFTGNVEVGSKLAARMLDLTSCDFRLINLGRN